MLAIKFLLMDSLIDRTVAITLITYHYGTSSGIDGVTSRFRNQLVRILGLLAANQPDESILSIGRM